MALYNSIEKTIGQTPLLECVRLGEKLGLYAKIYAKLEYFNPAGSVKDRVALYMINDAERRGILRPGSVIVEPTSGNTGLGLCAVAAARGYRTVIVMPDSMSPERRKIMSAYGADVILTPGAMGMRAAIAKAEEIAGSVPGSFIPSQFENPANPKAHYETTGPEIYSDLGGAPDFFVAGAGTGGTVSGVGKYLKEKSATVKIVAVEPADSPVLSGGKAGPHKIQGIGAGFVPEILDTGVIDSVETVLSEDAFAAKQLITEVEGVFVGISSGAALSVAIKLDRNPENAGKKIVVLLPDSGERYMS